MATIKRVEVDGVGTLLLTKHRRAKNLKLTVLPSGEIRVTLPSWLPMQAGLRFAIKNQDWIDRHRPVAQAALASGIQIGKSGRLVISARAVEDVKGRVVGNEVRISHPVELSHTDPKVQKVARSSIERFLRIETEQLLPKRLAQLASELGVTYHSVSVKKLRARWGSCNASKDIVLNLYLMQLPWHLIDYVLLHELTHTVHLHHGADFWAYLTTICPDTKAHRRELKTLKPSM